MAFVRREKVPRHDSPAWSKAWPVAPDLAVEVASPNQYRPEMAAKARLYLAAGTRLVWVVWPGQWLDGEDPVPGFGYPVADLFR